MVTIIKSQKLQECGEIIGHLLIVIEDQKQSYSRL